MAAKDIAIPSGDAPASSASSIQLPFGGVPTARMYLINLATGIERTAQFNPTEFSRTLEVEYARQTVPGLSHKVMHIHGLVSSSPHQLRIGCLV